MSRTAAQIRTEFIEFFRERQHTFVPGSPVVPYGDPTLLFTNAGMNQFKDVFLGDGARAYTRAANSQACIRAGGKHNDLDDVGKDTYHHTLFEMLGNWSFGDYFKREAVRWAWELLTDVWGLEPDRLHATYFGGDEADGIPPDEEARELWGELLPNARIHAGSKKDNFWEMGETGPCGPCSELHIDLTPDKTGGKLVNRDDARVIEIWNLVFIQFNRGATGTLTPLPAKHVDTGMGLERVAAMLQGHHNNYATDVFVPIIEAIERMTGHRYGSRIKTPPMGNRYAGFAADDYQDVACRVIADHIRALSFALADGAMPDNAGVGYVLRRILRRAVRYGWQYLKLHEPFLCKLVPAVVDTLGDAFPKLKERPSHLIDVIREEEESFNRTLERGIALFEDAADRARTQHHGEVRGEDAFKLHDTYGFPIDLTQIMAEEKHLRVDIGEYTRLMDEARERSRASTGGLEAALTAFDPSMLSALGATDDAAKYSADTCDATLNAMLLFTDDGHVAPMRDGGEIRAGQLAGLIFDRTCFYAEQGGQVGDTGSIRGPNGEFGVTNALRRGDVVVHIGSVREGALLTSDACTLTVDPQRAQIKANHTATHVLNWALRQVLGDHVDQKGSLVDADKTRFDFAHGGAVKPDEIERIEALCAEQIAAEHDVHDEVRPQEQARAISSLRAVFGEKYPDNVRVVSVGVPVETLINDPQNADWSRYSVEFCGGTHVSNTREIERFVLTAEEAVAKGVRRMVGVTGPVTERAVSRGAQLLRMAGELAELNDADALREELGALQRMLAEAVIPIRDRGKLLHAIGELQGRVKELQKAAAKDAAGALNERIDELLGLAEKIGNTTLFIAQLPDAGLEQIKNGADRVKQKCGSAAVLVAVDMGDKAMLLAAMSDDLIKQGVKAGDLVKHVAPLVEGGGGGPPTMAQAGGKDPSKIPDALAAGRDWIAGKLGG